MNQQTVQHKTFRCVHSICICKMSLHQHVYLIYGLKWSNQDSFSLYSLHWQIFSKCALLIALKAMAFKSMTSKTCPLAVEEAAGMCDMSCDEEPEISISKTQECKPNICMYQHNLLYFYWPPCDCCMHKSFCSLSERNIIFNHSINLSFIPFQI